MLARKFDQFENLLHPKPLIAHFRTKLSTMKPEAIAAWLEDCYDRPLPTARRNGFVWLKPENAEGDYEFAEALHEALPGLDPEHVKTVRHGLILVLRDMVLKEKTPSLLFIYTACEAAEVLQCEGVMPVIDFLLQRYAGQPLDSIARKAFALALHREAQAVNEIEQKIIDYVHDKTTKPIGPSRPLAPKANFLHYAFR